MNKQRADVCTTVLHEFAFFNSTDVIVAPIINSQIFHDHKAALEENLQNKSQLNGPTLYKHNMNTSLGMPGYVWPFPSKIDDQFVTLMDIKLHAQNQL